MNYKGIISEIEDRRYHYDKACPPSIATNRRFSLFSTVERVGMNIARLNLGLPGITFSEDGILIDREVLINFKDGRK